MTQLLAPHDSSRPCLLANEVNFSILLVFFSYNVLNLQICNWSLKCHHPHFQISRSTPVPHLFYHSSLTPPPQNTHTTPQSVTGWQRDFDLPSGHCGLLLAACTSCAKTLGWICLDDDLGLSLSFSQAPPPPLSISLSLARSLSLSSPSLSLPSLFCSLTLSPPPSHSLSLSLSLSLPFPLT